MGLPGRSEAWLGQRHRWLGRMDTAGFAGGRGRQSGLMLMPMGSLF